MPPCTFSFATPEHIPEMHVLRMSVKENVLSNPSLVSEKDYVEMLAFRGKGWVAFIEGTLAGFAIVDILDQSIWALFVAPDFEKRGVGRILHEQMLHWSFAQPGVESLWLATAPKTRAETFYRKAGWRATGVTKHGEIRFEMDRESWLANQIF